MKTLIRPFIYLMFLSVSTFNGFAQTKGIIYKPTTSALGKSVLDPNGDGFISLSTEGFTGTQDWGASSELVLTALPSLEGEPHSDLTTGSNGGHTDLVSNASNTLQSSYVGVKTVGGVDYFIVRMRIGGASTATKGYSILIDTDGAFSAGLLSSVNPGYDKEVVLETGNSGRVAVYNHSAGGTTLHNSYNLNEYHQRSVAASAINSDADYFYDFFVPLSGIGISTSQMIRMTAATVTSAQSGIAGTISDFNGIDDKKYANDRNALMLALVNTFPSASLDQLSTEGFTFSNPKTPFPFINDGILTNSTSISGTSVEVDGTTVYVYKNGNQIGSTTVSSNLWTLNGVSGLIAGNEITAKAIATNKSLSDISNTIIVSAVQNCFISAPQITGRASNAISGTWSGSLTPNGSNVRIQLYTQTNETTITLHSHSNVFVQANGSFSVATGLATNDFNNTNFIAIAIDVAASCNSAYSNVSRKSSGNTNTIGEITTTPTLNTTTIYQSSSSQTINVTNNATYAAKLILYVNGTEISATPSTVAAAGNYNFSIPGLLEGDIVSARAQGTGTTPNYWLSNVSNTATVTIQNPLQSNKPIIIGSYVAGSAKTVSGTSVELAGSIITLYKGGNTLLGTTTVTAFNTWSISGLTLATSDVLTAYAKANGKTLSLVSASVTVAASAPAAPTITGSYTVGNTSISGGSGNGTVTVYVGGSPVGTVSNASGNWTLSGLNSTELYRGAIVYATNTVSAVSSVPSNNTTVAGVASFIITDENDTPLTQKVSGDYFRIKVKAKDGNNGGGNDFTAFTNGVTLTSTSTIHSENVSAQNFSAGVLNGNDKTVTLLGKGTGVKLIVVNPNDPSAFGETTLDIVPAEWMGQSAGDPTTIKAHNQANNWTHSRVPASGASIKFASNAVQDLTLQADYNWGDVDFNGNDKHIVLGNYNLTVSSLTNRVSNVVKTTGSGKLKMTVGAGQSVTFPVANAANNFIVVTNNASEEEEYSVRVLNSMMTQGTTGAEVSGARVGRVWDLHKETSNASTNIDVEFKFNNGEVIDYTANGRFKMYHYTNNQWTVEKSAPSDSSNSFAKFTNYTGTFSPFGVGDGIGSALPVELGIISATCENEEVKVEWTTVSEYNSDYFQLEVSRDGLNWMLLPEKIEAAHYSNSTMSYAMYISTDYQYARLIQTDFDGAQVVYGPILTTCIEKSIKVFPNPCKNEGFLALFSEKQESCQLTLLNNVGVKIQEYNITLTEGNNLKNLDFSSYSAGIYTLVVSRGGKIETTKWVIQ